jgi:hypothetical protein
MNILDTVLAISTSILTVLSTLVIVVRWLVRHYFDDIKHELKPNSGKSLKDQVNRMEQDLVALREENIKGEEYHKRLDDKIDFLTKAFIEYSSKK